MTHPKSRITVTIDPELLARVRLTVEAGPARSVSAYIAHAVRCQLADDDEFAAMLVASLAATGGPPTPEELDVADRMLGLDAPADEAA
ncbi:MAG: ribbon-helix-helix domain-containing protein [bacterium]|nr:ribbon-helix-helix domain-containing protein [bacterium]